MKRIIKLTESDLTRIVKRVINESKKGHLTEQEVKDLCLDLVTKITNSLNTKINEYKVKNPNVKISTFSVKTIGSAEGVTPRYGIFYGGSYDLFNQQGVSDGDLEDKSGNVVTGNVEQTLKRYRNMINNAFSSTNTDVAAGKLSTPGLKTINQSNELLTITLKIFDTWAIQLKPTKPVVPQKPGAKQ